MNDHYVPTINDMQQTMRCNMKLLVFLDQGLNSVLRILDLHIFMQRIYILFKKKCLIYFVMNEKMTFSLKKFKSDFLCKTKNKKNKKKTKKQNKTN